MNIWKQYWLLKQVGLFETAQFIDMRSVIDKTIPQQIYMERYMRQK